MAMLILHDSARFALFTLSAKNLADIQKNGGNLGVQKLAFWVYAPTTAQRILITNFNTLAVLSVGDGGHHHKTITNYSLSFFLGRMVLSF